MQVELPFTIIRACRCSFEVEIDGKTAFISNQNLLTFMQNPNVQYRIEERRQGRDVPANRWILVCVARWELGFRNPIYLPNGDIIR